MLLLIFRNITLYHIDVDAKSSSGLAGMPFVSIAFIATQVVIAVYSPAPVSAECEHSKKSHRVGTAAQRYQETFARLYYFGYLLQ